MRFSVRELLALTGCLAGYIAFCVAMTRIRIDDPEWLQTLTVLMPVPLVVWLTRKSYLQRAGLVLMDLTATPNRRILAWHLLPPIGFALPWILLKGAEVRAPSILLLGYCVYVWLNWRRCTIRERLVSAFGYHREWKDRPAEIVSTDDGADLRIVLGRIGPWVIDASAPIPADVVEEVRAILAEK